MCIRNTLIAPLYNILPEGTLEPCHLHLVLSKCLIALVVVAVKQKFLDMLMTLGGGDKALKCLCNYVTESTTRVLQIRKGNFNLACTIGIGRGGGGGGGGWRAFAPALFEKGRHCPPLFHLW